MHAAAIDGHVAIGLEVARRLAPLKLAGSVKFAFSLPKGVEWRASDDPGRVLDKPRSTPPSAFHLWNDLPVGTIGIMLDRDGISRSVRDRNSGPRGHAAAPHQTIDPVLVAAHVITACRAWSPGAGSAGRSGGLRDGGPRGTGVQRHSRPCDLRGTVRTFGGHFFEDAPRLVEETAQGIAAALGARATVHYRRLSAPLINNEELSVLMRDVAAGVIGVNNVRQGVRTMGGEDMATFWRVSRVLCLRRIGTKGGRASPHHSPRSTSMRSRS